MSRYRSLVIILLAFAGANIDAASYISFGRVFTANMTGNTILFGLSFAQRDIPGTLRSGIALIGFILGAIMAEGLLIRSRHPGDLPGAMLVPLLFEVVVLVLILLGWWQSGPVPDRLSIYRLIFLSAITMGSQSAAVRYLHIEGIATTYITGTLTGFSASFMDWLRGKTGLGKNGKLASSPTFQAAFPALQGAVWLIYGLGAVAGGIAAIHLYFLTLLLPIFAILAASLIAYMHSRKSQI